MKKSKRLTRKERLKLDIATGLRGLSDTKIYKDEIEFVDSADLLDDILKSIQENDNIHSIMNKLSNLHKQDNGTISLLIETLFKRNYNENEYNIICKIVETYAPDNILNNAIYDNPNMCLDAVKHLIKHFNINITTDSIQYIYQNLAKSNNYKVFKYLYDCLNDNTIDIDNIDDNIILIALKHNSMCIIDHLEKYKLANKTHFKQQDVISYLCDTIPDMKLYAGNMRNVYDNSLTKETV